MNTDFQNAVPESVYYSRHFRLPGFSEETQTRLRAARVLIVGVGGLGCPIALYLAGAGVGTMAICDGDVVSASNLHRQVLFDIQSLGEKKVDAAAKRLRAVNPHISIETIDRYADSQLLTEIVPRFDLVIDGSDNFAAKYLINDACEAAGVPLVFGSIFQFEGQVAVFHLPTAEAPKGYSYRDVYPDAPPHGLAQNCGEAGVIGVLPGIIGTLQANEAIKILTGLGEPLSGYLLVFDALGAGTKRLTLTKRLTVPIAPQVEGNEIDIQQLQHLLRSECAPTLIDVRELNERQIYSIGGTHIPLAHLPRHLAELPRDRDIVVYCKSGARSAKAAMYLRSVLRGNVIFNLRGGLDASHGEICHVNLEEANATPMQVGLP